MTEDPVTYMQALLSAVHPAGFVQVSFSQLLIKNSFCGSLLFRFIRRIWLHSSGPPRHGPHRLHYRLSRRKISPHSKHTKRRGGAQCGYRKGRRNSETRRACVVVRYFGSRRWQLTFSLSLKQSNASINFYCGLYTKSLVGFPVCGRWNVRAMGVSRSGNKQRVCSIRLRRVNLTGRLFY